jgi:hypothetical protein
MDINAKNPQQNTSKSNPAAYQRDYKPWSNGIYPRNTRALQHKNSVMPQINRMKRRNTWAFQLMQKPLEKSLFHDKNTLPTTHIRTGFELKISHFQSCLSHTSSPFCSGYFGDGVSETIYYCWKSNWDSPDLNLQVARSIGMNHWHLTIESKALSSNPSAPKKQNQTHLIS